MNGPWNWISFNFLYALKYKSHCTTYSYIYAYLYIYNTDRCISEIHKSGWKHNAHFLKYAQKQNETIYFHYFFLQLFLLIRFRKDHLWFQLMIERARRFGAIYLSTNNEHHQLLAYGFLLYVTISFTSWRRIHSRVQ